jgi:hypothetical protein
MGTFVVPLFAHYRCPLQTVQAALTGGLLTWQGFGEMDEVSGDGSAELLDNGTIEIEFAYHNGDEAVLKAKRETSSTACQSVGASTQRRPDFRTCTIPPITRRVNAFFPAHIRGQMGPDLPKLDASKNLAKSNLF